MSQHPEIPETFNGKPTSYHFLDGYLNQDSNGRLLYLVGFLLTAAILPLFIEWQAYSSAKENAEAARKAVQQERMTVTAQVQAVGQGAETGKEKPTHARHVEAVGERRVAAETIPEKSR